MEIRLKIADDSVAARNIEHEREMRQLSPDEAALSLLKKVGISTETVPQGINPDVWAIVGAFKGDAMLL